MDIRGVEITNQLRSAIRAKLLELGVRYDEELPDYILVMVVNKKSRQQMNEDLNLFLEDSTEPFVNWLHDQVLKKLQKVTVAKKKNNKETPATATIKKEEEQKKFKIEDESNTPPRKPEAVTKQDRDREFEELVGDLAMLNEEDHKLDLKESRFNADKSLKNENTSHISDYENESATPERRDFLSSIDTIVSNDTVSVSQNVEKTPPKSQNEIHSETLDEPPYQSQSRKPPSIVTSSIQSLKYPLNTDDEFSDEKDALSAKRSKVLYDSDNGDKIKSSINKPKITSVVSVKTRLSTVSPTKKLEQAKTSSSDVRSVSSRNHLEVRRKDVSHRVSSSQSKSEDRRKREESRTERNRNKSQLSEHSRNDKSKVDRRLSNKNSNVKSRLGIISSHQQDVLSLKSASSTKVSKPRVSNVKSRLGVKVKSQDTPSTLSRLSQLALISDDFQEDDDAESDFTTSLRSHIIAVNKLKSQKSKEKSSKATKKQNNPSEIIQKNEEDDDDIIEEEDLNRVPSKVIVTPRPLKPLQPFQKRATQSLLLKAVAEANKSVVMQKKVDPCLKEQKANVGNKIKITRDPNQGKIVSVSLNPRKRPAVEKIKVELDNAKKSNTVKAHSSKGLTIEHLDLVKSLFKRSDDSQKFLVTLNGYNNNFPEDRNSDYEEDIEMEANDEEELDLENNQYDLYTENEQELEDYDDDLDHDIDMIKQETDSHHLNHKTEGKKEDNADYPKLQEDSPKKKRKLSPIVYTRSRSNSPTSAQPLTSSISSVLPVIEKRPTVNSIITTLPDKSSDKCRYWPNCTLGMKCAYFHPEVSCSSFPACKFGDKCAYQHPKCKFGSACTKLGCIFSHPPMQCKYHPYCMKPGCQFSHPKTSSSSLMTALPPLPPDLSSVRAKFVWKKKD